jgi:hypothetical protein
MATHNGDWEAAHRVLRRIGKQRPGELKQNVLVEMQYLTIAAEIPEWIGAAYRNLFRTADRGPVWAHLATRLGN